MHTLAAHASNAATSRPLHALPARGQPLPVLPPAAQAVHGNSLRSLDMLCRDHEEDVMHTLAAHSINAEASRGRLASPTLPREAVHERLYQLALEQAAKAEQRRREK